MNFSDKQLIALALVAAAVLYYVLKKAGSVVGAVTAPVVNSAADAYASATYAALNGNSGAQSQLQGAVILPDGSAVPIASLASGIKPVQGSNSATFNYNGQTFYLTGPSDANGNYQAATALAGASLYGTPSADSFGGG